MTSEKTQGGTSAATKASRSSSQTPRERRRVDEATARVMLLSAASKVLRERGISGLTIAVVLDRAQLGTRIFYRNFASKDELVQAVFVEMARVETLRLRREMSCATNPLHGVAAWIVGRLDRAFDPALGAEMRAMSREAQSQLSSAPQLISGAFDEMLAPLCEQLEDGIRRGLFIDVDAGRTAHLIHGTLWACTEFSWATGDDDRVGAIARALAFCLRGLGAPEADVDYAIKVVTRAADQPARDG